MLKAALSFALSLAMITASIVSCGGKSSSDDDPKPSGSSGSGQGGAGSLPERCAQPADPGFCNAFIPSFFHSSETGVCEPFVYGGCEGNDNRFDSVEACQEACSGGENELDTCESPAECKLASVQCCPPCDGGLETFTAINVAAELAFYSNRSCPDIECAACPAPEPQTANRTNLTATCRANRCVPVDVRAEGLADCETDADCFLRRGLGCCDSCDSFDLVALSQGSALIDLACGDDVPPCPPCQAEISREFTATCIDNRCAIVQNTEP